MIGSVDAMLRLSAVLLLLVVDSPALSADCRAEVEAAFQNLHMPGRAYRRQTTMAASVHVADPRGIRILRETAEFIPPDRKRRILDYDGGQPPTEMIRVGERTWMRQYQAWFEGYGWVDQDTFRSGLGSTKTRFECLGTVAFEGKTYAGYRTSDDDDSRREIVVDTAGKIPQEPDLARLRQQLTLWRTILVDRQTRLPAYEIFAIATGLDSPIWKMEYTYSRDIKIEPPVQ
ncbi:MAG TPA: hypothetical protein VKF35_08305 [Hyphomicrobiaceae bacterium]|nr:hypothetical protein [Hyphomicrobiaceae bacterium]